MGIKRVSVKKHTPPKMLRLSLCGSAPPKPVRWLYKLRRLRTQFPGLGWMLIGIGLALAVPVAFAYAAAHRANPGVGGELFVVVAAVAALLAGAASGGDR